MSGQGQGGPETIGPMSDASTTPLPSLSAALAASRPAAPASQPVVGGPKPVSQATAAAAPGSDTTTTLPERPVPLAQDFVY